MTKTSRHGVLLRALPPALFAVALVAAPRPAEADLEWDPSWNRVDTWEYVATVAVIAGAAVSRFAFDPPPARWEGGVLMDRSARNALRIGSREGRERAGRWSDRLWYASMGVPLLVDALFVTLAVEREPEIAGQLVWTNLEVVSLSALLATSSENIGRQRPMAQGCPNGEDPDGVCGTGEENRSFLSGHTVAAFAGAGLVCSTHQHMHLWGGGAADVAACATFVGMATATAVLRVASDNHWASDVLVSGGIGFAAGYFIPSVLRFGLGQGDGDDTHVAVVPLLGETRGLAVAGTM